MNTTEIDKILRSDCELSTVFDGVYPSDRLPRHCGEIETAVVMNVDPHHLDGSHWVCVFIDKHGKGEYFDSYGQKPCVSNFVRFMNNNCKSWTWNDTLLQALDSDVCGHYCIWFLSERARGKTMDEIVSRFTDKCDKNDQMVRKNVISRFKKIASKIQKDASTLVQCCTKMRHNCIGRR